MSSRMRRFVSVLGLMGGVVAVLGAAQGARFPTGTISGGDGTTNFSLTFDSAGTVHVYVNNQAFSSSRYSSKADTVTFAAFTGADGNGCPAEGSYLWKLAEKRMSFTVVKDACEIRTTTLTGIAWTRE